MKALLPRPHPKDRMEPAGESSLPRPSRLWRARAQKHPWLAPLVVLVLAAVLRLWQSDLTPFLDDEASLLTRGIDLLSTGHIPLVGGAFSIGVREPPLMTFLLAPMLFVSRSPAWTTSCFCAFDAAAAVCVYFTARRLAGMFAGLGAGVLYAVAPAAIYFTRRTDYYGLIPFFVALTMLCLVHAWQRGAAGTLAAAFVTSVFAVQLHPISAMLLPVWVAAAIMLLPRLRSYWPFAAAAALAALSLTPYVYLQAHSGWADLAAVSHFFRAPKTTDWSGAAQALTVIGGGTYQELLLPAEATPPLLNVDAAGWLLAAMTFAGSLYAIRRRSGRRGWWIVAALAALPVMASIRHAGGVLPYYMLPMLAPATVLAGGALTAIPWRGVAALLLAAIAGWQVAGYAHFQSAVTENGPSLRYGMPLRYEIQAASLLRQPEGSRVFVAQRGNQSASFPYLTAFRYQISHSDSRYGIPIPATASAGPVYVVEAGGPPYDFLASHFGPPSNTVQTPGGKPVFGLFHLPADVLGSIEASAGIVPASGETAEAVQVRGYAAPHLAAGQASPVMLEWTITNSSSSLPPEVQQFVHLVDAEGVTWSTNSDERAYPRREWRAGDTLLTWFDLAPKATTPTGGYWLEAGFYGYTTGEPAGSPVRVGPLRLAGGNEAAGAPRAVFGDGEIGLMGVRRQGLAVTLTWKALRPPRAAYTVFVHLLNDAGQIVAQHDGPPQSGAYPTTLWQPGDVVEDVHHLAGEGSGTRIEIGLYTRPALERLPVTGASGTPLGDHLTIPG